MVKQALIKPEIIHTREGMEAAITDYFKLQLTRKAALLELEAAKLAVEKKHEGELNRLAQEMERKFASVQNYCELHRSELLPGDKKSFETVNSVVKFYFTSYSVEKVGKETLVAKAKRLLGLVFKIGPAELDCAKYVREADPELNKAALLADRTILTPEMLRAMGIKFEQEEVFAIEPKGDLADTTTAVVGNAEVQEAKVAA